MKLFRKTTILGKKGRYLEFYGAPAEAASNPESADDKPNYAGSELKELALNCYVDPKKVDGQAPSVQVLNKALGIENQKEAYRIRWEITGVLARHNINLFKPNSGHSYIGNIDADNGESHIGNFNGYNGETDENKIFIEFVEQFGDKVLKKDGLTDSSIINKIEIFQEDKLQNMNYPDQGEHDEVFNYYSVLSELSENLLFQEGWTAHIPDIIKWAKGLCES